MKKINFLGYIKSPFDDRDWSFSKVMEVAEMQLPDTYIIPNLQKVLNQGSIGSCVAHACSIAMSYGESFGEDKSSHDFSRGFIYANRKETDWQGEGMYIRQALKQLNHYGNCEYDIFPWNEKYPKVKERFEADKENYLNAAKPYKIINYFRLYNDREIKIALMKQGAVVLGMPIYSSFKAECPLPADTDTRKGGHAMCLVGWDETGWIIQNSWGKYWGNKGLCHVPYEYPFDEWWGLTVNTDVPMPKKKSLLQKIFEFLSFIFKKFKK